MDLIQGCLLFLCLFSFFLHIPGEAQEVTPRFSLSSMADRRMIRAAAVRRVRQTGALLPRLMNDSEPGETQRPHGSPWETKGLFFYFDCSAEGGITLPNEQAESRGTSLCSG